MLFRPKGAEDCECRPLWYAFRAPSGEGGRQVTSENVRLAAKPQMGRGLGTAETNLVAGFSWQGSHGKSPLRRGGAVSGKAPDGARTWDRGNKSRCSVLMAGFSWPRGGAISSNYRIPQLFKRGSLFPKLTLYQGFGEPHRSYVYVCTCIATVNNSILVAHSLSLHT